MLLDAGSKLTELFPFIKTLSHPVTLDTYSPKGVVVPHRLFLVIKKGFCRLTMSCTHNQLF